MSKVCLAVIFNHRYDKNLGLLEKIYKGRFKHIYFIVPFYNGDRENVIPVYECSFRFSGYVAQAFKILKENYEHYIFIADDMVLNPEINENNYKEWFNLEDKDAYITWRIPIGRYGGWGFGRRYMDPLPVLEWYQGTIWKNEIINADDAFRIAEKQGYKKEDFQIALKLIWNNKHEIWKYPRLFVLFFKILLLGKQQTPYPIWGGYSDIFIIPGSEMEEVAHMMGVLAGMNMYVEMAIPTTLSLRCQSLKVEKDTNKKTNIMWGEKNRKQILDKYDGNYKKLVDDWDSNCLYMHPIKLSQWKIEDY